MIYSVRYQSPPSIFLFFLFDKIFESLTHENKDILLSYTILVYAYWGIV